MLYPSIMATKATTKREEIWQKKFRKLGVIPYVHRLGLLQEQGELLIILKGGARTRGFFPLKIPSIFCTANSLSFSETFGGHTNLGNFPQMFRHIIAEWISLHNVRPKL